MGDGCTSNSNKGGKDKKKNKKKNRGGSKKKMTHEQVLAFKSVSEWVFLDQPSSALAPPSAASCVVDDFGVQKTLGKGGDKVLFELHSHSKCSDGFLSPSKVIEKAHMNGVSFFNVVLPFCLYCFSFFFNHLKLCFDACLIISSLLKHMYKNLKRS